MNIFRLLGDLSHLAAILILLWKMWSVSGIFARSQILYFIVFVTRYLDLFTTYISEYNSLMKKRGYAETITAHYLFALGIYRGLYFLIWVMRYYQEDFFDPIAVLAEIVQTVLC